MSNKISGGFHRMVHFLVRFGVIMFAKCMTSSFIHKLELEKNGKIILAATELQYGTETRVIISKI